MYNNNNNKSSTPEGNGHCREFVEQNFILIIMTIKYGNLLTGRNGEQQTRTNKLFFIFFLYININFSSKQLNRTALLKKRYGDLCFLSSITYYV